MIKFAAVALAALAAIPAFADETTGRVLAYDRKDGILVLKDKTVWQLSAELLVPADLGRGDTVRLTYETAGEDGLTSIDALERTEVAMAEGAAAGN